MSRSLRIEYPGAFYHIMQRGIEKRDIFVSDKDKEKFLSYFELAHKTYTVNFHSYILMNNHYHLILETPLGNLSKVMHYLNTSYAVYFNSKYKRVGPVYQGRFKAILVEQDEYLHYLSRYIHLNSIRAGMVKSPEEYRWSSYRYFMLAQKQSEWLKIDFILSIFNEDVRKAKKQYEQFVLEGIGREEKVVNENIKAGIILGGNIFFENIKARFIDKEDYEIPILRKFKNDKEVSLGYIREVVKKNVKDNEKMQKKIAIYLSRRYTQEPLKGIAQYYGGIKYTGVSQIVRRMEKERKKNKRLNSLLERIEANVNLRNV